MVLIVLFFMLQSVASVADPDPGIRIISLDLDPYKKMAPDPYQMIRIRI